MVQGVGFRYFTRKQANTYGVTGWVRNTPNNKVSQAYHFTYEAVAILTGVKGGGRGSRQ